MSELTTAATPSHSSTASASIASAALLAALAGGVLVEVPLLASGTITWPAGYQWIASAVLGKAAFADSAAAWIGLLMHAGVSLFWATIFALVAARFANVRNNAVIAGIGYGLAVYAVMQGILILAGTFSVPTPRGLSLGILDHTLFFGLPVAIVASHVLRRRAA